VKDEPITLDAMQGFIAPILVRKLLVEFTCRVLPFPEWAKGHPVQQVFWLEKAKSTTVDAGFEDVPTPTTEELLKSRMMTIGGIPFRRDHEMPNDVIEFYRGKQLVGKIFNLAKPPGL
jgi:hypothetical protein